MNAWILVIALWPGLQAGQTVIVPNLESYQECARVYAEIRSTFISINTFSEKFVGIKSKCIEAKVKK